MSKIPDTPKTKYNHNDPFRWVDSQWEKFMTEQKEHKAIIKQLQEDLARCFKNFQIQRKQLEDLVARVPSSYLTNSEERTDEWRIEQFNRNRTREDQVSTIKELDEKVKELFSEPKYIYERNPDTGQMYRRELGNYDDKVLVDENKNTYPTQLELFQPNDVY